MTRLENSNANNLCFGTGFRPNLVLNSLPRRIGIIYMSAMHVHGVSALVIIRIILSRDMGVALEREVRLTDADVKLIEHSLHGN